MHGVERLIFGKISFETAKCMEKRKEVCSGLRKVSFFDIVTSHLNAHFPECSLTRIDSFPKAEIRA